METVLAAIHLISSTMSVKSAKHAQTVLSTKFSNIGASHAQPIDLLLLEYNASAANLASSITLSAKVANVHPTDPIPTDKFAMSANSQISGIQRF